MNAKRIWSISLDRIGLRPVYRIIALLVCVALVSCATLSGNIRTIAMDSNADSVVNPGDFSGPRLDSLEQLTTRALRRKSYGSSKEPLFELLSAEENARLGGRSTPFRGGYVAYRSDGLRIYARLLLPAAAMPAPGYPTAIFAHGWVGLAGAASYSFLENGDSASAEMVRRYLDAGIAVVIPGFRGHGVIAGRQAEGIEYIETWDNSSYLSPLFYAIDLVNLYEFMQATDPAALLSGGGARIDSGRISLSAHSQGADAALAAMAVIGNNPAFPEGLHAASLWSGCIAGRTEQALVYGPMADSPQSFLAGDGSWNGTAIGAAGEVNPDFVFGFPGDGIGTPDVEEWSWQRDVWIYQTVEESLRVKLSEMYDRYQSDVKDLEHISYQLSRVASELQLVHDPKLADVLPELGGFRQHRYLDMPVHLHYSDRDYYSLPEWNLDLARRIRDAGGMAETFEYPGVNHSLRASEHDWFAPFPVEHAIPEVAERDIRLFLATD